jgi:hypothetical protein
VAISENRAEIEEPADNQVNAEDLDIMQVATAEPTSHPTVAISEENQINEDTCIIEAPVQPPTTPITRNRISPFVSFTGIHYPFPLASGVYHPPSHPPMPQEGQMEMSDGQGSDFNHLLNDSDESVDGNLEESGASEGMGTSDTEDSDDSFAGGASGLLESSTSSVANLLDHSVQNFDESILDNSDEDDPKHEVNQAWCDNFMNASLSFHREIRNNQGNARQLHRMGRFRNLGTNMLAFDANLRRSRNRLVRAPLREQLNDIDLFSNSSW